MKVEFYRHSIEEADIERVGAVLRSIFLTTGEVVTKFENKLAAYLGVDNVVCVSSCTTALHLSLLAWGISHGDEVITTPMTFCATSNAIIQAGAVPVFVDVEEETGNINTELIKDAITDRTKAILPVHLYGQMCDMKKIRSIADRHNLIVIEDSAHCIEGIYDGIRPSVLSDAACFSFYATKNLTSGEGGAIATNDSSKAEFLRKLSLHGIDRSAAERYTKKYQHWDMDILGYKANMSNIQAALLIGQIDRIDSLRESREDICQYYQRRFDEAGIRYPKVHEGSVSARHLFTIWVDEGKRDNVLFGLQDRDIGVAVNYRAVHTLKFYREYTKGQKMDLRIAEMIGNSTISIPMYPKLTDVEMRYVADSVIEVVKG